MFKSVNALDQSAIVQDTSGTQIPAVKKVYTRPELVEYGDIVTLTRGINTYHCDHAQMARSATCT